MAEVCHDDSSLSGDARNSYEMDIPVGLTHGEDGMLSYRRPPNILAGRMDRDPAAISRASSCDFHPQRHRVTVVASHREVTAAVVSHRVTAAVASHREVTAAVASHREVTAAVASHREVTAAVGSHRVTAAVASHKSQGGHRSQVPAAVASHRVTGHSVTAVVGSHRVTAGSSN